ncbi:enhanced intracellular survival protein Eis [Rhodococcus rhodnii]|nr:enhanced intracellular survival protein Eis [Rhodococcus rhodnii]TXG89844.1 enhanced intracellular survival protein Eis [Rhodococcus rhodnii]
MTDPSSSSDTAGKTEITVHTSTEADWPTVEQLDAVAFGHYPAAEHSAFWRSLVDPADLLLAREGDTPVGVAMHLPLEFTVPGGEQVAARGITWVSVAPTHRRRGILRTMFTALHEGISATGAPISALTASEGGIYSRFGYGPATVSAGVSLDRRFARFLDTTPDPGGVRIVDAETARTLLPEIYERWRLVTPGAQARPEQYWERMFADSQETRGGATALFFFVHPDGYAAYRYKNTRRPGEDDALVALVTDFVTVTNDAHAALWRTLCGLDLTDRIEAHGHPDDPLRLLLTDYRLPRTVSRTDDLWLRIMNVPAALRLRRYAVDLSTVVEVEDPFLDAGGRFALEISGGRASCERTDAPARFRMRIDVLAGMYLGAHRARGYAAANRLWAADPAELTALDNAFCSDRPAVLGWGF